MKRLAVKLNLAILSGALALGCAATDDAHAPDPGAPVDLYEQLVADEVPVQSAIVVDVAGLPVEDPSDPRVQVGVNAPVDVLIDFAGVDADALSSAAMPLEHGAIRALNDGFLWTAVVESDGATALRLNLSDVVLPAGVELWAYNATGDVAGPYTGDHEELWMRTLNGDRVTLQLRYDGDSLARVLATARLNVFDVGVLDDRFAFARYSHQQSLQREHCKHETYTDLFNAICVQNAMCPGTSSAVDEATNAVALIVYASGGGYYICSGGLIADTDDSSTIPYFLTANHCLSRGREAKSVETYFKFTTSCDTRTCDFHGGDAPPTTSGSSIVATNRTGDFTLLRLDEAPSGVAYLPYNNDAIAFTNGALLYRISHPSGAPQAYSEHRVDTSKGTCSSWPRGSWIYSTDLFGATEGGSSGSPVLNGAGEVVGQLSGGCGTNVTEECDTESNATVDGALASYWDQVAPFLAPSGGGGGGDCTPSDENCSDGVDNDCDGYVDGDDPDCGAGTCTLAPVGASCNANSKCCSNKCKGKPGAQTCK